MNTSFVPLQDNFEIGDTVVLREDFPEEYASEMGIKKGEVYTISWVGKNPYEEDSTIYVRLKELDMVDELPHQHCTAVIFLKWQLQ